jgi:hypothetical protein
MEFPKTNRLLLFMLGTLIALLQITYLASSREIEAPEWTVNTPLKQLLTRHPTPAIQPLPQPTATPPPGAGHFQIPVCLIERVVSKVGLDWENAQAQLFLALDLSPMQITEIQSIIRQTLDAVRTQQLALARKVSESDDSENEYLCIPSLGTNAQHLSEALIASLSAITDTQVAQWIRSALSEETNDLGNLEHHIAVLRLPIPRSNPKFEQKYILQERWVKDGKPTPWRNNTTGEGSFDEKYRAFFEKVLNLKQLNPR